MKITELPGSILYIEGVFDKAQDFIDQVEEHEKNPATHSVMPPWQDWYDSVPVKNDEGNWDRILDDYTKGRQKLFDWDVTATNKNTVWPKVEMTFVDEAHRLTESTINLIHEPYLKALEVWYDRTGNNKLEYVSKNYFLRKYHAGGRIGPHIDKNIQNPLNTMDWSVLFYLNDNYTGGEITFPELELTIKPSAGSAIFFPCTAVHEAKPVESGEKYYIFMVIHSEFNYSSGLGEPYHQLNEIILKHKGITEHPLFEAKKAK